VQRYEAIFDKMRRYAFSGYFLSNLGSLYCGACGAKIWIHYRAKLWFQSHIWCGHDHVAQEGKACFVEQSAKTCFTKKASLAGFFYLRLDNILRVCFPLTGSLFTWPETAGTSRRRRRIVILRHDGRPKQSCNDLCHA